MMPLLRTGTPVLLKRLAEPLRLATQTLPFGVDAQSGGIVHAAAGVGDEHRPVGGSRAENRGVDLGCQRCRVERVDVRGWIFRKA